MAVPYSEHLHRYCIIVFQLHMFTYKCYVSILLNLYMLCFLTDNCDRALSVIEDVRILVKNAHETVRLTE